MSIVGPRPTLRYQVERVRRLPASAARGAPRGDGLGAGLGPEPAAPGPSGSSSTSGTSTTARSRSTSGSWPRRCRTLVRREADLRRRPGRLGRARGPRPSTASRGRGRRRRARRPRRPGRPPRRRRRARRPRSRSARSRPRRSRRGRCSPTVTIPARRAPGPTCVCEPIRQSCSTIAPVFRITSSPDLGAGVHDRPREDVDAAADLGPGRDDRRGVHDRRKLEARRQQALEHLRSAPRSSPMPPTPANAWATPSARSRRGLGAATPDAEDLRARRGRVVVDERRQPRSGRPSGSPRGRTSRVSRRRCPRSGRPVLRRLGHGTIIGAPTSIRAA